MNGETARLLLFSSGFEVRRKEGSDEIPGGDRQQRRRGWASEGFSRGKKKRKMRGQMVRRLEVNRMKEEGISVFLFFSLFFFRQK